MGASTSRNAKANSADWDQVSYMSTNINGDSDTFVSSMSTMMPGVKARGGATTAHGDLSMWATARLEGGGGDCGGKGQGEGDCGGEYGDEFEYDNYTINTNNYRAALSDMRGRF